MKTQWALEDETVVVTGGAGFIGSHLVAALVRRGCHVRVLDNLVSGRRRNLQHCLGAIELIEGDVRDADLCREVCRGARYVLHQAALGSVPRSLREPESAICVNVAGTANVFSAARDAGVERVVYASSSAVYGDSGRLPKREGEEGEPLSPYAASKAMNETLARVFARCYPMTFVGLRYFNVYGPRQDPRGPYAAVIPRFFAACEAHEAPTIFGDGTQTRDFTFVGDVVDANLRALVAPVEGATVVNVGAGARITVLELAETICRICDAPVSPHFVPARPGDVLHSLADTTRALEVLGFRAGISLERGLRLTRGRLRRAA